jgi:hypothetical protein
MLIKFFLYLCINLKKNIMGCGCGKPKNKVANTPVEPTARIKARQAAAAYTAKMRNIKKK